MVEAVRAKMNCNVLETREYSDTYRQKRVSFGAVCGKEGEDKDFSKYTPSGECWMNMDPDCAAAEFFKPGKKYYVTFTEAPD